MAPVIRAGSVRRSASSAPAGIPARDAIRVASSISGRRPGVIKSLGQAQDPRAGSAPAATAGSNPARSSDDLPDPDGPSTISSPGRASCSPARATSSAVSCSRPKNRSASFGWNAASPG